MSILHTDSANAKLKLTLTIRGTLTFGVVAAGDLLSILSKRATTLDSTPDISTTQSFISFSVDSGGAGLDRGVVMPPGLGPVSSVGLKRGSGLAILEGLREGLVVLPGLRLATVSSVCLGTELVKG